MSVRREKNVKARRRSKWVIFVTSGIALAVVLAAVLTYTAHHKTEPREDPQETVLKRKSEEALSSSEELLKSLPKETGELIEKGIIAPDTWQVSSRDIDRDLQDACSDYITQVGSGRRLVQAGYLDLFGNVWCATTLDKDQVYVMIAKAEGSEKTSLTEYSLSKETAAVREKG